MLVIMLICICMYIYELLCTWPNFYVHGRTFMYMAELLCTCTNFYVHVRTFMYMAELLCTCTNFYVHVRTFMKLVRELRSSTKGSLNDVSVTRFRIVYIECKIIYVLLNGCSLLVSVRQPALCPSTDIY